MAFSKTRTLWTLALAASALIAAPRPSEAAAIDRLQDTYTGFLHSINDSNNEKLGADLTVATRSANGKFTGDTDGIPVTGKVTNNGQVTFTGTYQDVIEGEPAEVKVTGSGKMSASGLFVFGTYTLSAKGGFKLTFLMALGETDIAPTLHAPPSASGSPTNLRNLYDARMHGTKLLVNDDVFAGVSWGELVNGKAAGELEPGSVPLQIKLSADGKFKLTGAQKSGSTNVKIKGSGQLSASGKYAVGVITIKGKIDGAAINETFIYRWSEAVL